MEIEKTYIEGINKFISDMKPNTRIAVFHLTNTPDKFIKAVKILIDQGLQNCCLSCCNFYLKKTKSFEQIMKEYSC